MAPLTELGLEARSLVRFAAEKHDGQFGFGSMSCAIYDTAWVSLVTRTIEGEKVWAFPDCFRYVIHRQSANGGWEGGATLTDDILNTAASLLSLKRHWQTPIPMHGVSKDELQGRIEQAILRLQYQLRTWDIVTPMQVGFEIIFPSLLRLLANEGITFDFEAKDKLMEINATKMSGFKPEYLYTASGSTALHSLEAFCGVIDFDRIAHHKVKGSFMGSPSSTAAYLMHASCWDEEAEEYLCHVINVLDEGGGVPSAYPSTYFEYSWLLSTLLIAGFTTTDLACPELTKITDILSMGFQTGDGTIGFAPNLCPDVDDTAKGLLSLNMLQLNPCHETGIVAMIQKFETATHLQTYLLESDPSFSANCNALLTLLHQQNVHLHSSVVLKLVQFLTTYWWEHDGPIKDKWNICPLYPSMHIVVAFTRLLEVIDEGSLPGVFDDDLIRRASVALCQACLRPLFEQRANGSWNNSVEQTSYAILILVRARRLCFFEYLQQHLETAIESAAKFIQPQGDEEPSLDYLWVEKVTYASSFLTKVYRLAALKAYSLLASSRTATSIGTSLAYQALQPKVDSYVKLLHQTPKFSSLPDWQIRGSILEASLFRPLLRTRRLMIFPRENMDKDRYFDMIPCFWTACNNYSSRFASTSFLFDLMVISFLNFQVDEYMEAVAGPSFAGELDELRGLIDYLITNDQARSNNYRSGVSAPLARFVSYILEHPATAHASNWDRENLKRELRIYLLAHVKQTEDNIELDGQLQEGLVKARDTFFHWVRTTSADHTSCPYAFAFVSCSLSSSLCGGAPCFPTVRQKYFANAACQHLATMCRMHNDYGSVQRDASEGNLNSINFPEFAVQRSSIETRQRDLLELAEYERSCLNEAVRRLGEESKMPSKKSRIRGKVEERKLIIWDLFCDVTDLHGQIYIARDIASRRLSSMR